MAVTQRGAFFFFFFLILLTKLKVQSWRTGGILHVFLINVSKQVEGRPVGLKWIFGAGLERGGIPAHLFVSSRLNGEVC